MKKLATLEFMLALLNLTDAANYFVDAFSDSHKEESETEKKHGKLITGLTVGVATVGALSALTLGHRVYKLVCNETEADTDTDAESEE